MLWALQQGFPQGPAGCLTSHGCADPALGCDEFVMWVEMKSLCSKVSYGTALSLELLCVALGIHGGNGLVVPFL